MTQSDKDNSSEESGIVLTPAQQRSRRNRNIAIGLAIALCCVLFYVVTIAKIGIAARAAH